MSCTLNGRPLDVQRARVTASQNNQQVTFEGNLIVPYQAKWNEMGLCLSNISDVLNIFMQGGSWEVTLPPQEAATE